MSRAPSQLRGAPLALLFVLAAACDGAPPPPAPARPPNLVLAIADDQDYEHLGFQGPRHAGLTPAIDALATGGVTFPVAWSAPRCRPALGVLLTGREPHASGLYYNGGPLRDLGHDSLPRVLARAGYRTYAEGKFWEGHPTEAGFTDAPPAEPDEVGGVQSFTFVREDQERLLRFLDELGDAPFFVWWAPMLPHLPHDPPQDLLERFPPESIELPPWIAPDEEREYRGLESDSLAMVAWLDRGVGELLEALRARDLERDTLIVFLIDNGWANGHVSKGSPYEKGIQTPLVFHWPGRIEPGSTRPVLASTVDVMPTLLDYAGLEAPQACQGRSLRPWIEATAGALAPPRTLLAGATYPVRPGPELAPERDAFALYARDARWKYVRWLRDVRAADNEAIWRMKHLCIPLADHAAGEEELFDLELDPYERTNVADDPEHAGVRRSLREGAERWWQDTGGAPFPE